MKDKLSIIIAILVLGGLGYYAAVVRPERMGAGAEVGDAQDGRMAQPYTFRIETIRDTNADIKYEIEAKYPVLYGGFDAARDAMNREIKAGVNADIAAFRETAVDLADMNVPDDLPASEFEMDGSVVTATSAIVSIRFSNYSYIRGAAHPSPYVTTFNFDSGTGRRLALKDLFAPGSNYLKRISDVAIARLLEQYAEDENDEYVRATVEDGAGPKEENFKEFVITEDGLTIVFNPYQVGPYAIGIPEVVIAANDIRDIIDMQGPARFIWQ